MPSPLASAHGTKHRRTARAVLSSQLQCLPVVSGTGTGTGTGSISSWCCKVQYLLSNTNIVRHTLPPLQHEHCPYRTNHFPSAEQRAATANLWDHDMSTDCKGAVSSATLRRQIQTTPQRAGKKGSLNLILACTQYHQSPLNLHETSWYRHRAD